MGRYIYAGYWVHGVLLKRKSSLVSSVRQIKLRSSLLIKRHSPLPGKGEETPLQREMCAPFLEIAEQRAQYNPSVKEAYLGVAHADLLQLLLSEAKRLFKR